MDKRAFHFCDPTGCAKEYGLYTLLEAQQINKGEAERRSYARLSEVSIKLLDLVNGFGAMGLHGSAVPVSAKAD